MSNNKSDLPSINDQNVLVIGSIAHDHFFWSTQEHTQCSIAKEYLTCFGGKGLNQSVALARALNKNALTRVWLAGCVGSEEDKTLLESNFPEVDTSLVLVCESIHKTGQVAVTDTKVTLYKGANELISKDMIDQWLQLKPWSLFILQNEHAFSEYAIERAKALGIELVYNPAPVPNQLTTFWTTKIKATMVLVNAFEYQDLSKILGDEPGKWPEDMGMIIVTKGAEGVDVYYANDIKNDVDDACTSDGFVQVPSKNRYCVHFPCQNRTHEPVDTTGAGDTFLGYFVASFYFKNSTDEESAFSKKLKKSIGTAMKAARACIDKRGTSIAIPWTQNIF